MWERTQCRRKFLSNHYFITLLLQLIRFNPIPRCVLFTPKKGIPMLRMNLFQNIIKSFAATLLMPTRLRSLLDYNWNIVRQRRSVEQKRFWFSTKHSGGAIHFHHSPSGCMHRNYRHEIFVKKCSPFSSSSDFIWD